MSIIRFRAEIGFRGVLGIADGTLISIVRPLVAEGAFFSRKMKHAINAQMVYFYDLLTNLCTCYCLNCLQYVYK